MKHLEIKELVSFIHNNDEEAFNKLYKLLVKKLVQFAFSFLDDRAICEEIVNDIFVNLWLNRHKLNVVYNPKVYLYVSVKNACLNYNRGNNTFEKRKEELSEIHYEIQSPDPSQLLIGKELTARILNAVNGLPPRCKLVFKMVKEDDLSCNEVADILGLSNKTVFGQLRIALEKLDEALVSR
ncbi:RNA polymerase sigma-70 factor [Mucilaginibacter dorajii]|uniref:RNA polymerase sigma-70 factor n=1 Tax=Mucilaginibacter dorajii TaxID=692994 RepID=A0ABP7QKL0_9SPHI|nr:RNA polymerase sigma-70 factor [Mucilaginibacter dorajii]MCS3734285.1 RNA polymerase sigma-70 factor (ECF subfamily) [Mucilaginibacter dorajii]